MAGKIRKREGLTDAEVFEWLEKMRRKSRRKQGLDGAKKEPINEYWKWYWAGREFAYEEFLRKFWIIPHDRLGAKAR